MTAFRTITQFASPEQTCAFAQSLGKTLGPGDVILLEGGIGAGKTHFARCLIQSLLIQPEDVPSPTFTLVQEYETEKGALWHADLYRLSGPDEIIELGLTEAFETAICLVEWPDRLGDLRPDGAMTLTFSDGETEDSRHVEIFAETALWARRLEPLV